MPRTILDYERNAQLKTLLWGHIKRDNAVLEDGAKKLGMSPSTLSRRCKDPGSMTVDELLNFGRKYHVPIDELRQALRY
jgi:AraC-like DNA-binding protein